MSSGGRFRARQPDGTSVTRHPVDGFSGATPSSGLYNPHLLKRHNLHIFAGDFLKRADAGHCVALLWVLVADARGERLPIIV